MVDRVRAGTLRLRNRYYCTDLASQLVKQKAKKMQRNSIPTEQKARRTIPNADKSVFGRFGNGRVEASDLKLNLSNVKRESKPTGQGNDRELNFFADPRFDSILEKKKKLNRMKVLNRQREQVKQRNRQEEEERRRQRQQQEKAQQKQLKSELKQREIEERRRQREEILKSSFSYKFLKNGNPLFKKIEQQRRASRTMKVKPPPKNYRVPLEEILSHSKTVQMENQERQRRR